jgi:hypothetical protein
MLTKKADRSPSYSYKKISRIKCSLCAFKPGPGAVSFVQFQSRGGTPVSAETKSCSAAMESLLLQLQTALAPNGSNKQIAPLQPSFFAQLSELLATNELTVVEGQSIINLLDGNAVNALESRANLLEKLYYSLRAVQAAASAKATKISAAAALVDQQSDGPETPDKTDKLRAQAQQVVIHNRAIADKLSQTYNSKTFGELFELCRRKGVFAIKINEENGLVTTAEAEENWDMSGRQWVTDTVRCGDIERELSPHAWRRAMLTLCDFYNGAREVEAIEKSVADPNYYRQGGLLDGVAHIFIPHTLDRDETWFNNKRLESHGLALKAICDTVLHGAAGKSWGFDAGEIAEHGAKIGRTLVLLASYLKAINTNPPPEATKEASPANQGEPRIDFGAPSAGPWEEIPFPEGLTWDTEAIRSGFESLHNLLNNPRWDATSITSMRKEIRKHHLASWLASESPVLETLLRLARGKIIDRLFGQTLPVENPHRPIDCSLAFITTSTIALADDIVEDVQLHIKLLQVLEEKLVGAHGIVRYAPFDLPVGDDKVEAVFDSYLADNYWLLPALRSQLNGLGQGQLRDWGSSDCSSHEDYVSRVRLAREETEAQWCFVSVMAEGYLRQVEKLFTFKEAQANRELVELAVAKAGEFLNRSFARITAPGMIKANGRDCPAWAIPEAYEMVSPGFDSRARETTNLTALPGANTPLAWGQASLFSACRLFERLLPEIDELLLSL